jgi:hypothetical protein
MTNEYVRAPDLVAAAREVSRREGNGSIVSIWELLDELSGKFDDRFPVSPDTYSVSPDVYKVLDLIETLWGDPHIDQVPNTGCIEFAWNEKGFEHDLPASGLKSMLLSHSQIPPATETR